MVEKIIVNPESVRGLGNIISPKNTSDFVNYMSNSTSSTDTVNNQNMTVYTLNFGSFVLTITPTYVKSGSTLTLTATLIEGSGPVEDATIKFYFEEVE